MKRKYWCWILFLLLHTACDRCNKQLIPYEEYDWGASIAIAKDGVQCIGSINGSPVIQLRGEITKNVLGQEAPLLCALFVPEDQTVDALAKAMQQHQVKTIQEAPADALPLNTLLSVNGSFVNYKCVEPRSGHCVIFSVSSLRPKEGLQPDTKYHVILAIKIGPHVFYDPDQFVPYTTPDPGASTQVTMLAAQCEHKCDSHGDVLLDLSMKAQVTQLAGVSDAGFLLIEQGDITPLSVLERHLEGANQAATRLPLLQGNTFTEHAPGVVVCRSGTMSTDGTFSISQQEDPDSTLKKGKTYAAFGLIEQERGGGYHYYVSPDSKEIRMPEVKYVSPDSKEVKLSEVKCVSPDSKEIKLSEVKMEVDMESVGEPALSAIYNDAAIGCGCYDVEAFTLEVNGKVVSHENTTDPVAGFLFVPQTAGALDDETARKKACDLIATATAANVSPAALPCFSTQTDHGQNYVVCITDTTDVVDDTNQPLGGKYSFTRAADKTSYLELAQDYYVYFWVQNAAGKGKVFLGETGKELNLFYARGALNGVQCVDQKLDTLSLRLNIAIETLKNGNNAEISAVFMKNNGFNASFMSKLGSAYESFDRNRENTRNDGAGWSRLALGGLYGSIYTWGNSSNVETSTYEAIVINDIHLSQRQGYTVHLLVRRGQVVYGIPSNLTYDVPPKSIQLEHIKSRIPDDFFSNVPLGDSYRGKEVYLFPGDRDSLGEAWLQVDANNRRRLCTRDRGDASAIRKALEQHYKGAEAVHQCKKFGVRNWNE